MALAIPPRRHALSSRLWSLSLTPVRRLVEALCFLPVAIVWFVLYRWHPNPP